MKEERILNALGEIDEIYIAEAAEAAGRQRSGKRRFLLWSAAACAAIAFYTCIYILTAIVNVSVDPHSVKNNPLQADSEPIEELPLLTSRFECGGMGFEGVLYYEISEAENANPWTEESTLDSLPVYRNPAYTDASGLTAYLSDQAMLTLAEQTAAALGTTVTHTQYHRVSEIIDYHIEGLSGRETYRLTAQTPLGEITVYGNAQIRISFSEPVRLPDEYNFTDSNTTDEEAFQIIQYLTERYFGLFPFDKVIADTGGDYTYYGDRIRYYQAYDGSGDFVQQLLSYHFRNISFAPDDDGNLFVIWLNDLLTGAQKVGDYPLISADTARDFLLNRNYITSVPSDYLLNEMITDEMIAKTELVYRIDNTNELFMPYYRFYVKLSNDHANKADGLTCYGLYYVPAVSGEYLSDFPVWDGRFN